MAIALDIAMAMAKAYHFYKLDVCTLTQVGEYSLAPKLWESCILTPGPLKRGSRAILGITLTPWPSSQSWN